MTVKVKIFMPRYGNGKAISPATTTATLLIRAEKKGDTTVVVTNLGDVVSYVRFGGSSVVATVADYPILAGSQVPIAISDADTHIATITASGTGSIHVITGEGI